MRTALVLVLMAGCVRSSSVTCDDGTVCREGTSCFAVSNGFTCISPGEVVCGNGLVEMGEVCDDGNTLIGDGCSSDCRSDETCDNDVIDPVKRVGDDLVVNEQCDDGVANAHISHDGCSSVCSPETVHWSNRRSLPSGRGYGVMVTDTSRRRIVMFGGATVRLVGSGLGNYSNETWELSGDGWSRLQTALSPAPRARHAMAFDGEETVLFGGFSGSNLGDTWTLDGNRWSLVATTGPTARAGHAMVRMPSVGIVLFGGVDTATLGDTWVFANGAWTDITATAGSPPARQRHVMAYDPIRDRIVMTGGVDRDGKYLRDTWELDGAHWTEVNPTAAPSLEDASAVFDRMTGQIIMQGGFGFGLDPSTVPGGRRTHPETYKWNGTTWVVVSTLTPERYGGGVATDPVTGAPIVYAGVSTVPDDTQCLAPCSNTLKDAWQWTGSAWALVDFVEFPQLMGATGAYDPDRRRVVVFGGAGTVGGANQSAETYELGASWRHVASTGPSSRWHSAMAYGVFGSERAMYLFGGRAGLVANAETWKRIGGTWTNANAQGSITARFLHAMAFDEKRGVIVLYGGATSAGPTADTWEFDGTTWTNKTPATGGPGPRMGHAMAYDPIRQQVLQFGGQNETGATMGGLWAWSGTEWTRLVTTIEPPERVGAGMAWDAARRRVVLFGGEGNDAWEWNGTEWSVVSVLEPPIPRSDHVFVRSPTGDGVMAAGGFTINNNIVGDVLHLVHESLAAYAACRSDLDDDLDGAKGCDDPDCWVACTPWCPPGVSCDPNAPSCGDGTCSAPRENCGICAADCGACAD